MIKKILKEMRLRINKFGSSFRRKKLNIKNPTIISNNCWAGIVSQYLGIKYYIFSINSLYPFIPFFYCFFFYFHM